MPMYSFLTRISPSLGVGTGRSVLYCRTSVPPVFSIKTPFMVFGIELEVAIVLFSVGLCNWDWIEESRAVANRTRGVFAESRLMIDMQ